MKSVTAGYAPNFLPGVVFGRAFFRRNVDDLFTYPSRGAFADYLALDVGRASLAVYSVNPLPAPLAPVELGFRHGAPPRARGRSSASGMRSRPGSRRDGDGRARSSASRGGAGGAVDPRLPDRQPDLRVPLRGGQARIAAACARAGTAREDRPCQRTASLIGVALRPSAAPVALAAAPGRVPGRGLRCERPGLPSSGPAAGDAGRLRRLRRTGRAARTARDAVPERGLVGCRLADGPWPPPRA